MNMDILARLRSGESIDAIAKEFTNSLNEASKTYEEEKKAAELKAKRDEFKKNDFQNIIDMILDYVDEYFPGLLPEGTNVDAAAMMPYFDMMIQKSGKLGAGGYKVERKLDPKTGKVETNTKVLDANEIQKASKTVEDVFNNFFKRYGI